MQRNREAKRSHEVGVLILLHLLYRRELLRKWSALQNLLDHAETMRILELNSCATKVQSLVRSHLSRLHDSTARVMQAWARQYVVSTRKISRKVSIYYLLRCLKSPSSPPSSEKWHPYALFGPFAWRCGHIVAQRDCKNGCTILSAPGPFTRQSDAPLRSEETVQQRCSSGIVEGPRCLPLTLLWIFFFRGGEQAGEEFKGREGCIAANSCCAGSSASIQRRS